MFRRADHTSHTAISAVYSIYAMHRMHILCTEYMYDLLGLVKTSVYYENKILWGILSPTMQCKRSNLPFSSVTIFYNLPIFKTFFLEQLD